MSVDGVKLHVERVSSYQRWSQLLSHPEALAAEKIHNLLLRQRFIVSRGLRRKILSECSGQPAERLSFIEEDGSKPRLETSSDWEFNISHAGEYVVLAVRQGKVGVDLEIVREVREMQSLVARYFHPDEGEAWNALPKGLRKEAFFMLWSAREAAMKCLGLGLAKGLSLTSVDPSFMTSTSAEANVGEQSVRLHRINAPTGYVLVVATA